MDTPCYTWARHTGYECSTRGDRRFSAFTCRLPDGRTIEEHYQCDVKGYSPGGTNWRLGKGRPSLRPEHTTAPGGPNAQFAAYVALWRQWASLHPQLMDELACAAAKHSFCLSDRFATSPINQAHALSIILQERFERGQTF